MAEAKLDIDQRFALMSRCREKYAHADKGTKGRMLDGLQEVTGLSRKTIIRHLRGSCERKPRRRERGHKYGGQVDDALRIIHEAYDRICAERLTPNLVLFADKLTAHGHLDLREGVRELLGEISVSTVRRALSRIHQDEPQRRPAPRRSQGLLASIPMERIACFESEPGHFEADLVHHTGSSGSGEYVHTLNMVDVATGWCEMVALLGRSRRVMKAAFRRVALRVPFPVLEVHTDNGTEFLNHHLVHFYGHRFKGVRLSRSRPGEKNDNRFVERANGAIIRRWLGRDRLDTAAQTNALNRLYDDLWVYQNFHQPSMRLIEKEFHADTRRIRRRWDVARTPYQRLITSGVLDREAVSRLQAIYERSDPLALRETILRNISALFELPGADPDHTEDIFQTLDLPLSIVT
jgi:hypothetical protein